MGVRWKMAAGLLACALVALIVLVAFYRTEQYTIVHQAAITDTNRHSLLKPTTICYSNRDVEEAIGEPTLLRKTGIDRFDFDSPDLILCLTSNCTVKRVVGRQNFGLIVVEKSATSGAFFTVIKGTKRFLQFNYGDVR